MGGLRFADTFKLLNSVCKSLRPYLKDPRFFNSIVGTSASLTKLLTVAPGMAGAVRMRLRVSDARAGYQVLLNIKFPNLRELHLDGDKMLQSFWQGMMKVPQLASLLEFHVDGMHSAARGAYFNAIPGLYEKMPCLVSVDSFSSTVGEALGRARGIGARSIVREIRGDVRQWSDLLVLEKYFPECEKITTHRTWYEFGMLAGEPPQALLPLTRVVHLEIKIGSKSLVGCHLEINSALVHLARIFPSVQHLTLRLCFSDYRNKKERKRSPAAGGFVNLKPLSALPLRSFELGMSSFHKEDDVYRFNAESFEGWAQQLPETLMRVRLIRLPARDTEVVKAFFAASLPCASVLTPVDPWVFF